MWLQTPNCNSLLIPNKPIFAGETSGSLFISGQQSSHLSLKLQPLAWCLARKTHMGNVELNSKSRSEDSSPLRSALLRPEACGRGWVWKGRSGVCSGPAEFWVLRTISFSLTCRWPPSCSVLTWWSKRGLWFLPLLLLRALFPSRGLLCHDLI